MSDLVTTERPGSIKKRFIGPRMKVNQVQNLPVEIVDYEIGKGSKSGNEVLYLQLKISGQPRFFWTEGFKLIDTIKKTNRACLPFQTKICWDGEGKYLIFKKC